MSIETKTVLFIFAVAYMGLTADWTVTAIENKKEPDLFHILSFFAVGGAIWTVLEKY